MKSNYFNQINQLINNKMNENEKKFGAREVIEDILPKNWKAFGAVSLGLLLNEKNKDDDWLNSVISKTTAIYSEFEKIEDSFDEDDIHQMSRSFDEIINNSQMEGASEDEIEEIRKAKENFVKLRKQKLESKQYERSSRNKKITALRKILGL